ncbi:dihydrodipicolinate synthase family protein [Enterococcus sp. DIV0242_7C1]|uniref:4-hydroxy-tetrahydrodipicolinate synthase n=1 Tax=Candidatus Enterococcus dunnyi TaxID=1834192 RepID=A0A200J7J5_9ENTE|nr:MULTISPECIES: dihydrodipicolinate synthase family protein [unclassified Enterococcus]MBO0470689.1 dihydrodipicolinate synthase family protein [Enterococcus sp. DIV0242_7C1]OUZ33138.1 hypothetical protein A5889_001847 [Enterococcus sp. 9D6_DIV0238]
MSDELKNSYHVAVPTAFYEDEALNVRATLDHILYLQTIGVRSFLVCGSTGEQHSLTLAEKISLLNEIENEDRIEIDVEIIFGLSSIRQKEAVALAKAVDSKEKISSILVGFSPYILPTQSEAVKYVEAISFACEKPMILYNNPKRTGFNLETASFLNIVETCRVIGLKEAGDENRILELKSVLPEDFYFYAGGENKLKEKVALGFNRLSSISGNLYPLEVKQWFESLCSGNDEAFYLESEINKIFEHSPLTYLKAQLSKKEHIQMGMPRSPLGNQSF